MMQTSRQTIKDTIETGSGQLDCRGQAAYIELVLCSWIAPEGMV